jgi:methylaspartate ammonia-lyase
VPEASAKSSLNQEPGQQSAQVQEREARCSTVVMREVNHQGQLVSVIVDMSKVCNETRFVRNCQDAGAPANVKFKTYTVGGSNEYQVQHSLDPVLSSSLLSL